MHIAPDLAPSITGALLIDIKPLRKMLLMLIMRWAKIPVEEIC